MGARHGRVEYAAKRPRDADDDDDSPEPITECPRLASLVRLVHDDPTYAARCVRAGSPTIAQGGEDDMLQAALAQDPIDMGLIKDVLQARSAELRRLHDQYEEDRDMDDDLEYQIQHSAVEAARRAVDMHRDDILQALLDVDAVGWDSELVVLDEPDDSDDEIRYTTLSQYKRARSPPLPWIRARAAAADELPARTSDDILQYFERGESSLPPGSYDGVPAPAGGRVDGGRRLENLYLGLVHIRFPSAGPAEISGPGEHAPQVIALAERLASKSLGAEIGVSWPPTPEEREISAQLAGAQQVVRAARGVVGPHVVTGTHLQTNWPSGAPIDMWVVCLGEYHLPQPERKHYVTVKKIMQAAAQRARRLGVCVDAFIEESWWRSFALPDSGAWVRRDRSRPRQVTGNKSTAKLSMTEISWSMAGAVAAPHAVSISTAQPRLPNPLGNVGARIHWFDSRAENHVATEGIYYGEHNRVVFPMVARWWLLSILGWDDKQRRVDPSRPLDPGLLSELERLVGPTESSEWLDLHRLGLERMARRSRKIPPEDLAWLIRHLVETMVVYKVKEHNGVPISNIFACVADFYLLLRMFVPYPTGRACAAGPPRHCLVYAGAFHTDHVNDCLEAMGREPGATIDPVWRVKSPAGVINRLEVPIEQILQQMGLPALME